MTQMLAQREHDYFAETVICANIYIITLFYAAWRTKSAKQDVFNR